MYSWRLEPTDKVPQGKKPGPSLRELEKQIGYDLDSQMDPTKKSMTVLELVGRYLATKTGVKPSTRANYQFVLNFLKQEDFGGKKIGDVKTSDAKLFLIKMQAEGRGYSSVKTVRGVLRPAFQMAVDDDYLQKNPFGFQLAGVVINDSVTREAITRDQIDNMDSLPEKDDRSLLNTIKRKTKVLVTSRIALRNMKPYGLGKLDPDPALEYFYRCYLDEYGHAFVELSSREDAEYVRHIIEAAAYNALLIELIGGLARWEFRGKLGDLWEKLKDNIFSATSKVELENEHSASHGLSKEDLKLQDQISRLYALSSLSEGCKKIMNFMARFPAEMSVFDDILDWAGFDINDLKWLTDRAWVEQTQEGYLLHTMVRGSVLKQEIEFDIWEYGNLIDKLGYTKNYMPVKAGYVTVRKRLDTVSILGGLLSDSLEAKLEDVEDYRRMHIYGAFLNNLSGVYYSQGNYEEALKYFGKALQIYKKVLGEEHPDIAAIYNNLAVVYYCQGNYEEALKNYGKALEIKEKVLGEEHLDTAATYNNLAGVYGAQRKYDEALRYYTKALEIRKKYLGEEYPDTASIYNNLAGVYSSQGNYEEALKYYEKALKIREKVLRKEHPDIAATYNNLALIYQRQRKYEDSLKYYGKALEIQKKVLGEEHPDTATTYFNMGVLFCSLGDPGKAVGYIRKALPIFEKVLGDAHPYTKQARDLLEIVRRNMKP